MIPVPPKGQPVFILFSTSMNEMPLPKKSILVLVNKFNSFFASQCRFPNTSYLLHHAMFANSCN